MRRCLPRQTPSAVAMPALLAACAHVRNPEAMRHVRKSIQSRISGVVQLQPSAPIGMLSALFLDVCFIYCLVDPRLLGLVVVVVVPLSDPLQAYRTCVGFEH